MANLYSNMYGGAGRPAPEPKPEAPVVPKAIPPAHQRLSGLKLTGSHMHEVEIDGRTVTMPSAAYVKLLEDQIRDAKVIIRKHDEQLRRLTNAINRLSNDLEATKLTIPKSMKRF